MTHLILHKVRGEPAFDVAEKLLIGDEEGWIIPTSGHRAYPYQTWRLDELGIFKQNAWTTDSLSGSYIPIMTTEPPKDWPDHYECNDTGLQTKVNVMAVISRLLPKIKRRL